MVGLLTHAMFGDGDAAREGLARYADLGEALSQPSVSWYAMVLQGVMLLGDGRLSQAEETIERARAIGREVQAWDAEVTYRLAVAMLRWEQDRLGEVENLVRDATTRFPGYRVFRCLLTLCHMEAGRTAEASALLEEILAAGEEALPYNNDWLAGMTLLAEVASRLRLTAAAQSMYEAMTPYGHLVGMAGGEPFTGSMQRPLAQMAALMGDLDRAREHHEHALEVHTRMRIELWIAHSEFDLAEVLCAQADRGESERTEHLYARALHRARRSA